MRFSENPILCNVCSPFRLANACKALVVSDARAFPTQGLSGCNGNQQVRQSVKSVYMRAMCTLNVRGIKENVVIKSASIRVGYVSRYVRARDGGN